MRLWSRSLQGQLAIRLAAVFLVATAIGVAAIVYKGYRAADALENEELGRRGGELAQAVVRDTDGTLRFSLPPDVASTLRASAGAELFAVLTSSGGLITAS